MTRVNGPFAPGSARVGENIRFTVNGVPALLKDTDGQNYQAYIITAPGSGNVVTVDVSGPGSYPLGDVNVSGKRDAADALLVLKYDVGLTPGVTTWPPGPATVYLPLCDVTAGRHVQLKRRAAHPDVRGGPGELRAAERDRSRNAAAEVPADAPPVYLSTEQEVDATDGPGRRAGAGGVARHAAGGRVPGPALRSGPGVGGGMRARTPLAGSTWRCATRRTSAIRCATPASRPAASSKPRRCWSCGCGRSMPQSCNRLAGGSPAIEITEATLFDLDGNALRPVLGSKEPAETPRQDLPAHHPGRRRQPGH